MEKRNFLKGASVLLIAAVMILSTFAVTANTNEGTEQEADVALNLGVAPQNNQKLLSLTNLANFGGRDLLWNQYDTDGSNGLSHSDVTSSVAFDRDLLDDFEVPAGEEWTLTDLHSLNLWNTLQPGVGTDFFLEFWSDNAGIPGGPLVTTTTVSYTETATGRTWFNRAEFEIEYVYEPVVLAEGRYWIYAHVIGPENCFWMAKQDVIWGTECWTDYDDIPPMGPGTVIFLEAYDLAFQLTGTGGGQPAIPDLDCDGTLSWTEVTPGETVTGTFTVENIGDPLSLLDWQIESYPDWGTWTFDPDGGTGLLQGETETVNVEIVAPDDPETNFTGEVVLVNSDDSDDTCIIDVSLATPVSQQSLILQLLEMLAQRFPILGMILATIF